MNTLDPLRLNTKNSELQSPKDTTMKTEIKEDIITVVEVPGPASGTLMTKEYVQMVGQMAYIWGWPLVNMGTVSYTHLTLPTTPYV